MAQYYKLKEHELNSDILTYYNITDLNYYEEIVIINNEDYEKVIKDLDIKNVMIVSSDGQINDNNPIYLNLKILNNANNIYLREKLNLLEDDNIKGFISSFRGIIICDINLISYLIDNNIIKDKYNLEKNTYLIIDKYGISNIINIA